MKYMKYIQPALIIALTVWCILLYNRGNRLLTEGLRSGIAMRGDIGLVQGQAKTDTVYVRISGKTIFSTKRDTLLIVKEAPISTIDTTITDSSANISIKGQGFLPKPLEVSYDIKAREIVNTRIDTMFVPRVRIDTVMQPMPWYEKVGAAILLVGAGYILGAL